MPDPELEGYPLSRALREATARLRAVGIDGGRADAVALVAQLLEVDPGEVERRAILGAATPAGFEELLARRAERVPLQHLTGVAPFRHVVLRVGPGVFTPRPETEVLVGLALEALDALDGSDALDARHAGAAGDGSAGARVVDLCTGSGAIAVSIARERPSARVAAVELSPEAHAYARANVEALAAAVDLRLGDATTAFGELDGTVDVVATNPPYIPDGAIPIDPEVALHDPALALYGGGDGLELPMRLVARAAALLRPGGVLLVEHGERQGEDLVARLAATGAWVEITDHEDLTGRPRVLRAVRATGSPVDSNA